MEGGTFFSVNLIPVPVTILEMNDRHDRHDAKITQKLDRRFVYILYERHVNL